MWVIKSGQIVGEKSHTRTTIHFRIGLNRTEFGEWLG